MSRLEMAEVVSAVVRGIGYDAEGRDLYVEWKNGQVSVYGGVPELVAHEVMSAPSIGRAIYELVKGRYQHRYELS